MNQVRAIEWYQTEKHPALSIMKMYTLSVKKTQSKLTIFWAW